MSHRVLVTEPIIREPLDRLRNKFHVDVGDRGYYDQEDRLIEDIDRYDAILTMLSNPITDRVIEAADSLRIIANMAAGYDNIDLEAADEAGIHVSNTPGVLTHATADAAFALLLAAARRIPESEEYLRKGEFDGWHPLGFLGMELANKTLGILGMGRIGTAVAERARGFGMEIIYHNRNRVEPSVAKKLEASYVNSVHELARRADILSLNCPLNDGTHHAVDGDVLEALGENGIVVNTARGAVVDEQALIQALHEGSIGAAALDVYEQEPNIPSSLMEAPHCVMTPHIGSATWRTRNKMGMLAFHSINASLQGTDKTDIPNLVV